MKKERPKLLRTPAFWAYKLSDVSHRSPEGILSCSSYLFYPSVHCAVARATTTAMVIRAKTAWIIDRILARLLMIEVSVGPKAVLWLKARNR
jgi:hypothetical protein